MTCIEDEVSIYDFSTDEVMRRASQILKTKGYLRYNDVEVPPSEEDRVVAREELEKSIDRLISDGSFSRADSLRIIKIYL